MIRPAVVGSAADELNTASSTEVTASPAALLANPTTWSPGFAAPGTAKVILRCSTVASAVDAIQAIRFASRTPTDPARNA